MKEDLIELDILDNGMNFEGIARYNNKVVFVPGAISKEKVKVKLIKETSNFYLAELKQILVKSNNRVKEECKTYEKCGGCSCTHMTYESTLDIKKNNVKNVLNKHGIDLSKIEEIYGMGVPYNYRNKVQYPVRKIGSKNVMGMFSEKSHDLIEISDCNIQDKQINEIAKDMFDISQEEKISCYDELKNDGCIRNIMVRKGIHTDEVLCIYVVNNEEILEHKKIVDKLLEKYENIKGIIVNINKTKGNVILGDKNVVMYGQDRITDSLGDYSYYISTNSFFQVNTVMAETLFNILKQKLELRKDETLLELYSGVGTIGIFLSDEVKKIYGAEIVQDAVDMAKENVKLNNVKNAEYIVGDASVELEKIKNKGIYFDTIVVDPPRKGLDDNAIKTILDLKPSKIGYVSCNPATLARDLEILQSEYEVCNINLFDLFPWTKHVECVTVLNLK